MEWVTTSELLSDLRRADRVAWDRFLARFDRPVRVFLKRLGLRESEAEDVTQEILMAFVEAHRQGRYDREKGRLRSWLFGIAHRKALAFQRKNGREADRRVALADSFWAKLPDEASLRRSFDEAWSETVLRECITRVRVEVEPNTMEIFERVVLRHEQPAEVAARLGMTRNAVFLAKFRVMRRIRELVPEYEDADA